MTKDYSGKIAVELFVLLGLKSAGIKIPDPLCCRYLVKCWRREIDFWYFSVPFFFLTTVAQLLNTYEHAERSRKSD